MADFNNENQNGVFGGFTFGENNNITENNGNLGETQNANTNGVFGNFGTQKAEDINSQVNSGVEFKPVEKQKAVTKQGLWTKIRAFLFQEIDLTAPIKVELTPYQQKVEKEINDFLHQEISFKGISKLFGKK